MFISFLPSRHQEGRAGPLASCSGWSTWTYPWPDPSLLTGAGLGISDPRGTVDPGEADGEDVVGGICREYWGLLAGPAAGKFKRFQRFSVRPLRTAPSISSPSSFSMWKNVGAKPRFAVLRKIDVEEKGFCSEFILNLFWISPESSSGLVQLWGWALLGPPLSRHPHLHHQYQ